MKPYITKMSYRPGCPCCNSEHLHKFRGRMNQTKKSLKRSGKKAARRAGKVELNDLD